MRKNGNTKYNFYMFDLDGTLLDSKEVMKNAWLDVCNEFNIKISFNNYFNEIGISFHEILSKLNITRNKEKIYDFYFLRSHYHRKLGRIYPSIPDVLENLVLNNKKIGIVTSKDYELTKQILSSLTINFSTIQCPINNYRSKPAPDHLLIAMAVANIDPCYSVFIGDSIHDQEAANRAHVDFFHAKWGYTSNLNINSNMVLSKPLDILDI